MTLVMIVKLLLHNAVISLKIKSFDMWLMITADVDAVAAADDDCNYKEEKEKNHDDDD